jgi:hypothetical protein
VGGRTQAEPEGEFPGPHHAEPERLSRAQGDRESRGQMRKADKDILIPPPPSLGSYRICDAPSSDVRLVA